ncbi:MAG TPA: hypothetical protein VLE73_01750 [Candidatus Saccharimonadales bacterium]|nr:hypothetical protein [Candidatus Saccharimonadales bacterium]
MSKQEERKAIDKVFILLGVMATLALLGASALGWWGYKFATNQVTNELAEQQIYFPPKDSPALDPKEFPDLQQYAGQLVDTGPEAKAYANGFIKRHLEKVASGKTYAEVSTLAMKDPTNTALQQQKAVLFQGETLRGLLLGDGYAYWTFGIMAKYASFAALAGAGVMAVLVLLGWRHLQRMK